MTDDRDIVERLDIECSKIAFDDQALMREAAALIRALDEAVANVVSITMPAHASEWARPILTAATARHAVRTKRSAP